MTTPDRTPGFEENLTCAARFLGIHTAIPSERMEPKPVVTATCSNCEKTQPYYPCEKCGAMLCETCHTSVEFSHALCRDCIEPEIQELFVLLKKEMDAITVLRDAALLGSSQRLRVAVADGCITTLQDAGIR